MQATSDRQSVEAGCNHARCEMPAAGPLGNQRGCAVDVNSATLPHFMTSDIQGRSFLCPVCI